MKVRDLAVGETGRVTRITGGRDGYRRRLLAMGLIPGVEFTVTRHAPMGDPVEMRLRGYALSLRKHEAEAIEVERVV